MNDSEIAELLNLPASSHSAPAVSVIDSGTFQINIEDAIEPEGGFTAPKDQIVTGIKRLEQLAFIVGVYYKGKCGDPILPLIRERQGLANFHLDHE